MLKVKVLVYQEVQKLQSTKPAGWRWRARAFNGRIIADSAEAYVSQRNAERAARMVVDMFRGQVQLQVGKVIETL